MKRLILILLLLPSLAWAGEPMEIARMNPYVLGAGVASVAKSCDTSTIKDSQTGGLTDYDSFGSGATSVNYASKFTNATGSNYDLCQFKVIMAKVDGAGTDPGDFTSYIYTDDGGSPSKPSSLLTNGTCSSQSFADTSTSCTEYTFTCSTPPTLENGTTYWIVFKAASAGSATDYYKLCNYDTGSPGRTMDGYETTWNQQSLGQLRFKTYEYK